MSRSDDIEKLISLLDDEDDDAAVFVMAQLLERQDELGDLPGQLQESDNPLLRRRAHQLQAAITVRERRREFYQLLTEEHPDFWRAASALHMLWFDRDSRVNVENELRSFVSAAGERRLTTLEDARSFMCRCGFAAELDSTLRPENYCIGIILSQKIGAASLLMGILKLLMQSPEKFHVVRFCGAFALFDGDRSILLAQGDCRVCKVSSTADFEFFSLRDILHIAGNMLFSAAVNSDSFRYVLTIAQSLSGDSGDDILSSMPYPYGPGK